MPGTGSGSETATTEIHYGADGAAAADLVRAAFGIGELVADDAIAAGHVLVVVGTDLDVANGLRGTGSAFQAPAAGAAAPAAAAPASQAAAFAASVPCVN